MGAGRAIARRAAQFVLLLVVGAPAWTQEDELSLEFLEYLGSWEEGDEAWYVDVQIREAEDNGTPSEAEQEDD